MNDDPANDAPSDRPQTSVAIPPIKPPPSGVRRSRDLLNFYMAEVRRYPLLNVEQEKALAVQYQENGDRDAAERLVTANLRLVIKIAFQYHRQWSNVLDLIQEGNVGLVEALSRYDPYREIRFSSYAQYWIRAMILRFLLDNFRLVRLGSSRAGRKLFFQLKKERDQLTLEGVNPSPKALAERLGVSEEEVAAVDRHMRAPALSLHAPMGDAADGRPLAEMVAETEPNNPEDNTTRQQMGDLIRAKLAIFAATIDDERDQTIWRRRMVSPEPASLSRLGTEFGVSKERVRQLEVRLKRRLREFLQEEIGDELGFEFS